MLKCPHCGKRIPDSLITAHSGQIGGRRTAKRGSAYFRKIAAMRKNRRGGRPRKVKSRTKEFVPQIVDATQPGHATIVPWNGPNPFNKE